MCPEKTWNLITQQVVVPTWYMKHVFKDLRGSWRCLSFAKTKKKKYKSQAEVARSLNLQRASARARAAVGSRNREGSGADKSRWMFKSFSALYCHSDKRFKAKDSFSKMKNLINFSFESREAALSPTSSMNELIPTIDFDLENDLAFISSTDSDIASTGAPPSRRSSASFYYPPTPDTTVTNESGPHRNNLPSPYQSAKHQRKKPASIVREVKNSSTNCGGGQSHSHGAVVNDAAALAARVSISSSRNFKGGRESSRDDSRRGLSPDMSVSAALTMDTASSTPRSAQGWLDVYDLMNESLTSWTPSEKANSVIDIQSCTPSHRSFSGPLPLGGGPPRRDLHSHGSYHHKKPSTVPSLSQRPPSVASSVADYTDPPRRSVSSIGSYHNHHHHHHLNPPPPPRVVNTQKDFQEAIVDIILENDVNDIVDLEEFLQGYFRLNTLYQDIIQQFFNDLSNDLVNPRVSRAPTVFARLASHNSKSQSSSSKAKAFGKSTSSYRKSTS